MQNHVFPGSRARWEDLSDAELLRQSQAAPEAFGLFYERHFDQVLSFFYRRTVSVETAADLTAETFAAAFLARHRYKDEGAPTTAWLLKIARHKLQKTLRRGQVVGRARRSLGLEPVGVDEGAYERVETLVDLRPLRDELCAAMQSISPNLAQAVYLRVGLDLPYAEVALRLRCTESAARVRVMRGMALLSDKLEVT